MSFITTVSRNFVELFQWSCADQLFWLVSFILFKLLSSKRALLPEKNESEFPVDMHIYTLSPLKLQSFTKFCWAVSEELRKQTVFSSIFHFGQISKFKKGVTLRKKMESNFLRICTSTHYVLHNYIVSRNSVERFQRSCANKKNRTDGLTDWLTDRSKTLYPPQLVAWGIKTHYLLFENFLVWLKLALY